LGKFNLYDVKAKRITLAFAIKSKTKSKTIIWCTKVILKYFFFEPLTSETKCKAIYFVLQWNKTK